MTPESITIVLPLPARGLQPNCTIGSFGGRMMRASATKRYKRLTCEAIENEDIQTRPWKVALVEAKFYFKTKRGRDTDNAVGSLKSAYDGIVVSGLIPNDTPEFMRRSWPELLVDSKNPRVEIKITRIE
jgi:hypothetical protein